ncbi:hypothetical protein [Streptomyces aureus]|uniref:hypothetical protein n=1 Tax=Streptomyces aureus TaxID=193461 RepID=UPI0007C571BE|nr:hypothetical protein [Streptomyces aureus]
MVVARDKNDLVTLLSADFPAHDGAYLFLPEGRQEESESPLARRELPGNAGASAGHWTPQGAHAITSKSPARVHLFELAAT